MKNYIWFSQKILTFIALAFYTPRCHSQLISTLEKSDKFVVEGTIINGINYNYFFLQEVNRNLFNKSYIGGSLKLGRYVKGNHLWHKRLNYPVYGIGVAYFKIGKNDIVGSPISVFSYIDISLKKAKKIFQFQLEGGLGYFVNDKELFSSLDKNPVVGSRLNFHIGMGMHLVLPIKKTVEASISFKLQHYSNGNIRTPNHGVNLLGVSTGIVYKIHRPPIEPDGNVFSLEPIHEYSISPRFAFVTHREKENLTKYLAIINVGYWRKYSHISYFNIGLDNFYDFSLDTKNIIDKYYLGIQTGNKLKFNRLALIGQVGFLLKRHNRIHDRFYTRIAVEFKMNSSISATLSLKSRESISADFVEWGISCYLK